MRWIFLSSMLLLISGTAHAARPTAPEPAPAQAEATRIDTDQKTGAIRFIVNGQEQARIDATGLHVRHNVAFGGMTKGIGSDGYDKGTEAEPAH